MPKQKIKIIMETKNNAVNFPIYGNAISEQNVGMQTEYRRAVIYCRVSSEKQVIEGNGLDSQEIRCLKRAESLGLIVAKVFREEGVSGGLLERPKMKELISFLDANKPEKFVVVFDDLKRFARDVAVHLRLRAELTAKRHARLECLNFNFEDSPIGRAVETIMAATAQLEREQNAEQVKNKMKARLDMGYWPFNPPPGLKNEKNAALGKILIPNEPIAGIIKLAIEKYRDYELNTLEEVREFLTARYHAASVNLTPSISSVQRLLNDPLYCGYIAYARWGIPLKKAKHEGFITYATFRAVQEKMAKSAHKFLRKDYNNDFPLRSALLCSQCQQPMTGSFRTARQIVSVLLVQNKRLSIEGEICSQGGG
jgi:DNA invertase Pin-like site-specific DNA recombinase